MKKVYCENCKYVKKIEIKDATVYYCPLPTFLLKDADNTKYNCKYYKRKWWKFWIKKNRRTLYGYPSKTDARIKPDPRLISYVGPGMPKRRKK